MRVRYQTNKANVSWSATVTSQPGGSVSSPSGSVVTDNYDYSFMEDVVTPRFERRRSDGEIIMNPLTSLKSQVLSGAGSGDFWTENLTLNSYGVWVSSSYDTVDYSFLPAHRIITNHVSAAERWHSGDVSGVNSLYNLPALSSIADTVLIRARANAASPDALAAVTLAELDKTFELFASGARMTRDLVSRLGKVPPELLHELSKLRYKKIKLISTGSLPSYGKAMRELCSLWLGYRYGIMATYYDAASWLSAGRAVGKSRRARFTSSEDSSYQPADIVSTTSGNYSITTTTTRIARHTRTTAGVLIQANPEVGSLDSFGVLNVLSTAWELVPYSFVIDWFIDVGRRLAALEGSILRPVIGSWVVHRSQLLHTITVSNADRIYTSGTTRYQGHGTSAVDASLTENCELVQRYANPTVSYLPAINLRLNVKKVLDGISLLAVSSSKLRRLIR